MDTLMCQVPCCSDLLGLMVKNGVVEQIPEKLLISWQRIKFSINMTGYWSKHIDAVDSAVENK